jgi:hypothetical protein
MFHVEQRGELMQGRNTEGHNLDPMTGGCVDCGATREALDDLLFPTCAKFDGPHKLALIAIHQAASRQEGAARSSDRCMHDAEEAAVAYAHQKREFEGNAAALRASIDFLASAGMADRPKMIGLAEAIERDAPYFLRHFVTEGDQK